MKSKIIQLFIILFYSTPIIAQPDHYNFNTLGQSNSMPWNLPAGKQGLGGNRTKPQRRNDGCSADLRSGQAPSDQGNGGRVHLAGRPEMTFEEIDAAAQRLFRHDNGYGWDAVDECVRTEYRLAAAKNAQQPAD